MSDVTMFRNIAILWEGVRFNFRKLIRFFMLCVVGPSFYVFRRPQACLHYERCSTCNGAVVECVDGRWNCLMPSTGMMLIVYHLKRRSPEYGKTDYGIGL